jgi:hypothetical protein
MERTTSSSSCAASAQSQDNANTAPYVCPFPTCSKSFRRLYTLKNHLLRIRGNGGNEKHSVDDDDTWIRAEGGGLLTIDQRPGLTDEEKVQRRKQTAAKFRANNLNKIKETRHKRAKAHQMAPKLAKKAAKLALEYRQELRTLKNRSQFEFYRELYLGTNIAHAECKPINLIPPNVDLHTFPYFVAIYIPPRNWPKIIGFDQVRTGEHYPLINQIPGDDEFRTISLLLHPDRNRQIITNATNINFSDTELAALLNAGFDLWKPIIRTENIRLLTAEFVSQRDNETVFSAQSANHAKLMELFLAWTSVSMEIMNALTPEAVSFAEIQHFAHALPPPLSPDPFLNNSSEESTDEELDCLGDLVLLDRAISLKGKGKPGRPRSNEGEQTDGEKLD